MKIAVVIEADGSISQHFGRAPQYRVFTVEGGRIIATEIREKPGHDHFIHEAHDHHHEHDSAHQRGTGPQADDKHARMFAPIRDCETVIVGGMGYGGYQALQRTGVRPLLTELSDADAAVRAYLDGTLEDRTELLH
jgi:predicted Fe-Mo cluster-binding NifX family protein